MTDTLDYQTMTHNAMMSIVRDALQSVAKDGLPGEHHFYITFAPQHPGVDMPDDLRARQGDEMTIVLQHQFENLSVSDLGFQVDLAFDGVLQTIRIPFATILAFFDPSVEFGLRFSTNQEKV
ncbi:MAG: ClpXP protease specificity-enhancing factor SspB, partial [Pseudomonadota bacterium]|nr:ClpXP protease specificity-enhancing factor SspB [Pseudomonadota bacterium]